MLIYDVENRLGNTDDNFWIVYSVHLILVSGNTSSTRATCVIYYAHLSKIRESRHCKNSQLVKRRNGWRSMRNHALLIKWKFGKTTHFLRARISSEHTSGNYWKTRCVYFFTQSTNKSGRIEVNSISDAGWQFTVGQSNSVNIVFAKLRMSISFINVFSLLPVFALWRWVPIDGWRFSYTEMSTVNRQLTPKFTDKNKYG